MSAQAKVKWTKQTRVTRKAGKTKKMAVRFIDLSQPISQTPPGSMLKVDIQYLSHEDGTRLHGAFFGLTPDDLPDGKFAAVENVTLTTHSGTHLDAPWHYHPTMDGGERAMTIDEIPLEWCFGNGVCLDFRRKEDGAEIVAVENYFDRDKDFTGVLTKLRGSKPDALYIATMYNDGALMSKQREKLGWNDVAVDYQSLQLAAACLQEEPA